MITLEGSPALSPFRRERLQARLTAISDGVRLIDCRRCYFVQPMIDPMPDTSALSRILDAAAPQPLAAGEICVFVLTRPVTISPWAIQAAEIFRGVGLPVHRVETGPRP